ncbi:MAG: hypothetical protein AAFP16_06790 [Pseudomonadota bacterium]
MKLILTYSGELRSKTKDPRPDRPDKMSGHINQIRRVFHNQLKEHWRTHPFLREASSYPSDLGLDANQFGDASNDVSIPKGHVKWTEIIPELHPVENFRFLPLVRSDWHLQCELDILFLRKNPPGSLVQAGDIDNRIKTLLDGLRMAQSRNELGNSNEPNSQEVPFYCLLEDDQLISRLNIETGRLLELDDEGAHDSWVKLVIHATVKPTRSTLLNLSFV